MYMAKLSFLFLILGILNDLALVYDDMNENEAGALYEAALIILCGIYGNQHLDVAVTRFVHWSYLGIDA